MTLNELLKLIGTEERIVIVDGKTPFLDKHLYEGEATHFIEWTRENNQTELLYRTVNRIKCYISRIYIFLEKEKQNETN